MSRSLEMWKAYLDRTGNHNIGDYFIIGDVISTDLIDYIRMNMSLESDTLSYIQIKEIQGYYYDLSGALKPIFHTFSGCDNQWRYHGICHKWESINRS